MITADVIPISKKRTETAVALQHVGFRILFTGECITIAGNQKLFERFFKIKLLKLSKKILSNIPKSIVFYKPKTPPVIPDEFKSLIRDIVFPEPPEYF